MTSHARNPSALLVGALVVVVLVLAGACQADSGDDSSPAPRGGGERSPAEFRQTHQQVELEYGSADTFTVERQLGNLGGFQIDSGQNSANLSLSTSGTMRLEPGYKVVLGPDPANPEEFEFALFDQPDFDVTWSISVGSDGGSASIERTVDLCGSGGGCRASFTIGGTSYVVSPRARLSVEASNLKSGSFEFKLEDDPRRRYVRAGTRYTTDLGWTDTQRHDFEVIPEVVGASPGFAGVVNIGFDVFYVLHPRGSGGTTLARVNLMELSNALDTNAAPPNCFAEHAVELGASVTYSSNSSKVLCRGAGPDCLNQRDLYTETVTSTKHALSDFVSSCQDGARPCTPNAGDCGPNERCIQRHCIPVTPVRATLRWREDVDLDLVVWDDGGNRLQPLSGNPPGTVDGWMALTSEGTASAEGTQHIEMAVVQSARANQALQFQVRAPDGVGDTAVSYDLFLFHQDKFADQNDNRRLIAGELQGTNRSVVYELRNETFVGAQ